jgi:hypothetical protein
MSELAALQEEQAALARRIAALRDQEQREQPPPPPPAVPSEAELFAEVAAWFSPEPAAAAANELALKHLAAIVGNVARQPADAKFRRLRRSNAVLREQLFAHPAADRVLARLGFGPVADGVVDGGADDAALELPAARVSVPLLQAMLATLDRVGRRDAVVAAAQQRYDLFRRSVTLDVRQQRLADARAAGQLPAFVEGLLICNDAEVYGELFKLLEMVAGNVARSPAEPKFRVLKHGNAKVRDVLFPSMGGLEFMLGVLGFELGDDGLALPLAAADATADGLAAVQAGMQHALGFLAAAKARAAEKIAADRVSRRTLARAEMASMRLDERREMQRERLIPMDEPAAAPAAADDDDDDAPRDERTRIPMAEAIAKLMGNRNDDW